MVHGHEQPGRSTVGGAHQQSDIASGADVERPFDGRHVLIEVCCRIAELDDFDVGRNWRFENPLTDTTRLDVEGGPELIVVFADNNQRCPEHVDVGVRVEVEPHRLIPMVRFDESLVEEPVLDRREWHLAADGSGLDRRRGRRRGNLEDLADGLMVEHVPWAQLDSGAASAGHDLETDDRVSTEIEEVVIRADRLDAEHVGPDVGQQLLPRLDGVGRATRRADVAVSGSGSAARSIFPFGSNGISSTSTKNVGTMCDGSCAAT